MGTGSRRLQMDWKEIYDGEAVLGSPDSGNAGSPRLRTASVNVTIGLCRRLPLRAT